MKSKDNIILNKINNYIIEINDFINSYDYETFSKDRKTINACVFNLSQIGEFPSFKTNIENILKNKKK